jgi:hypothetical protein
MRIFEAMSRNVVAKILSLVFIVAFACLGIKSTLHSPAHTIENKKQASLTQKPWHSSNSELEGLYFPAATSGYLSFQKSFTPLLQLFTAACFYNHSISSENNQIRESSLLIKDYLSYIYPTHNFW